MKHHSDPALLALIQDDNEQAFACIIDRYQPVLLRYILRRTQSVADAQEILQDIFIAFWNKRSSLYIEESIYPYLFCAAKFEVIDWYVKNDRKVLRENLLLTDEYQVDFPAEDFLIARELNEILESEIAKMPPTMKSVFELSRNESFSVKEIAQKLSISEQTVKNNITIALKRLRHTLKHEHYVIIAAITISSLR